MPPKDNPPGKNNPPTNSGDGMGQVFTALTAVGRGTLGSPSGASTATGGGGGGEESIRHAFNTTIPTLQVSEYSPNKDSNKGTKSSEGKKSSTQSASKSTMDYRPSPFWVEDTAETLFSKVGDKFLDELKIKGSMPQEEPFHLLRNEGDVVRASNLYLVHPVNIAIETWRKEKKLGEIVCLAEFTVDEESRLDLQWAYKDNPKNIFAVVEFKKPKMFSRNKDGIIAAKVTIEQMTDSDARKAASEAGITELEARKADKKAKIDAKIRTARNKRPINTLFGNTSAMNISRQIVKYYNSTKCPYICHFDYETMICWDFSGVNLEPPAPGAQSEENPEPPVPEAQNKGKTKPLELDVKPEPPASKAQKKEDPEPLDENKVTYPHAIWFQETGDKATTENFRKLLLAFLIHALEKPRTDGGESSATNLGQITTQHAAGAKEKEPAEGARKSTRIAAQQSKKD